MIAMMQIFLRSYLLTRILFVEGKRPGMSTLEFSLLVLACILIAAGGYVINDIEDVNIDRINKPDKLIISKSVSSELAYNIYLGLTFTGIIIGFYLSYCRNIHYIGIINLVTSGLLYFYSTSYKCVPVLGNLIVAILTALSVAIVILPEPVMMNDVVVLLFGAAYTFFAFIMTFIRELIKDLEDEAGDAAYDCKTLPVIAGNKITKIITFIFTIFAILVLAKIQLSTRQWETIIPFIFLTGFVQLPLVWLSIQILKADDKKDFKNAGNLSKMIMFTGILSMIVFYFSFN